MRQPWLFANSRTSSSDMSRRTRNSAGWVTTYSDLIESLSPILAARAGKSLYICLFLTINCAIRVRAFFLQRRRWGTLWLTVQSGPKRVSSFAAGRRATRGWFLHMIWLVVQAFVSMHTYQNRSSAQALWQQFWLTGALLFLR